MIILYQDRKCREKYTHFSTIFFLYIDIGMEIWLIIKGNQRNCIDLRLCKERMEYFGFEVRVVIFQVPLKYGNNYFSFPKLNSAERPKDIGEFRLQNALMS